MTAYLLAALDMAGTTVDEGGLVYSAVEAAVAEAVGGPVPAGLMSQWKGTSKEEAIAGLLRAKKGRQAVGDAGNQGHRVLGHLVGKHPRRTRNNDVRGHHLGNQAVVQPGRRRLNPAARYRTVLLPCSHRRKNPRRRQES